MDEIEELKKLIIEQYIKPTMDKYVDMMIAVKKSSNASELGKAVDKYKPFWTEALRKDLMADTENKKKDKKKLERPPP